MHKTLKQIALSTSVLILVAGIFSGCGNGAGTTQDTTDNSSSSNGAKELTDAKKILYSLPSPMEAATLLKMAGATFDKSYLSPPSNASKFVANDSRALNLGVYGTDLTFANIFEQTQEASDYLKACNTLATGLGIDGAFGEDTYKRLKANTGNKDSMMAIISDASLIADAYFKENERPTASALSAAGGWIEGLYIATRIANKTKNEAILERVADQKYALNDLIAMMESYGSEKDITPVLNDLKEVKVLFDALKVEKIEKTPSSDPNAAPTVGTSKRIVMTEEQYTAIAEKIEVVRNKIIK